MQQMLVRIVEKLRELGWDDELDHYAPLYAPLAEHADVRKPQDLTERSERIIQTAHAVYVNSALTLLC